VAFSPNLQSQISNFKFQIFPPPPARRELPSLERFVGKGLHHSRAFGGANDFGTALPRQAVRAVMRFHELAKKHFVFSLSP
jgi:hypothetical protein